MLQGKGRETMFYISSFCFSPLASPKNHKQFRFGANGKFNLDPNQSVTI